MTYKEAVKKLRLLMLMMFWNTIKSLRSLQQGETGKGCACL